MRALGSGWDELATHLGLPCLVQALPLEAPLLLTSPVLCPTMERRSGKIGGSPQIPAF